MICSTAYLRNVTDLLGPRLVPRWPFPQNHTFKYDSPHAFLNVSLYEERVFDGCAPAAYDAVGAAVARLFAATASDGWIAFTDDLRVTALLPPAAFATAAFANSLADMCVGETPP